MFAYKHSRFGNILRMRRKANTSDTYQDVISFIGAPNNTVTDNAKLLAGVKWINVNRKYYIETSLTPPHHHQYNYAEGKGSNFKFTVTKLFHNTPHAPYSYWCFVDSSLTKYRDTCQRKH